MGRVSMTPIAHSPPFPPPPIELPAAPFPSLPSPSLAQARGSEVSLQYLNLSENRFDKRAMARLAGVISGLDSLHTLSYADNKCSSQAVDALVQMIASMPGLVDLDISGCSLGRQVRVVAAVAAVVAVAVCVPVLIPVDADSGADARCLPRGRGSPNTRFDSGDRLSSHARAL